MDSFYTVINCMDGRVQLPVINYIRDKFKVLYVDMITEPGPNLILSKNNNEQLLNSIYNRIDISIKLHSSQGIAIVGHYDCAGNPAGKEEQLIHLKNSLKLLTNKYPQIPLIALWLNEKFVVSEVTFKNKI